MKTHEELENLALKIHDLMDCDEHGHHELKDREIAIQLLDNLHSEGMLEAAEILCDGGTAAITTTILSAIENKPKV